MTRTLVLDAAASGADGRALVALLEPEGSRLLAQSEATGLGAADSMALLARDVLAGQEAPGRVIVVTGPGSFTGLRASMALAHGLAQGFGIVPYGVSNGAAWAEMAGVARHWVCVTQARRGRVFCEAWGQGPQAFAEAEIAAARWPEGTVILGSRADLVTDDLALERGWRVLGGAPPDAWAILRAGIAADTRASVPLYVDPPEAKPPAAGLRPAPV